MGKQTFMKGTMILVLANGLTKVIGALFKIPLTYLLHESGMGIYNTAYQLYVLFFIIATAGLPVAVSKMVSEQIALKDGFQGSEIVPGGNAVDFRAWYFGQRCIILVCGTYFSIDWK